MTLKDRESFFFCFAISLHAEIVFARISIGREVDIELTYYFVLEQRDTRRDRRNVPIAFSQQIYYNSLYLEYCRQSK